MHFKYRAIHEAGYALFIADQGVHLCRTNDVTFHPNRVIHTFCGLGQTWEDILDKSLEIIEKRDLSSLEKTS